MKNYKIGKLVTFITIAISIIFLMDFYVENLQYFIGGLIVLYGIDKGILFVFENKEKKVSLFFQCFVQLLLGICTIFLFNKIETICVIWAVWAIMREAEELTECYELFKERIPCLLNIAESIVAIVFSILLIKDPGEHHAKVHMILLIIELVTTVTFPICRELYLKYIKKEKIEEK